MMSPERLAHTRTKARAFVALEDGLKRTGLPCEAIAEGLSVGIDARKSYEPDASVVCAPYCSGDTIAVEDPIIVLEVLSTNTAAIDHGRKLSGYFSLPSVKHYLILDPELRVVIHHKQGSCDAIETRVANGRRGDPRPAGT